MKKSKYIFIIFSFPFIVFIGAVYAVTDPVFDNSKDTISLQVDKIQLFKTVEFLSSRNPSRNYLNTDVLDSVANYIRLNFLRNTKRVEEQNYLVGSKQYKNIIASFGPENAERIIVGAHYDVCENQPGADDNASGVAGLLELARLLKDNQELLKYRIDLVAFTLEEPPFFRTDKMGSAVHAKMLADNKIKVKAMVSLEMIGYFSDQPKSQQYPLGLLKLFYPTKGNYISVVGKMGQGGLVRKFKRNMRRGASIEVRSINSPSFVVGIDFSDHLNYWQYGFEAIMITDTSFYRNGNYHEKTDTIQTLDFERMAEVIKGVCYTLLNFSE